MENNIKVQLEQIDIELKLKIEALQGKEKNIFKISALTAEAIKQKQEILKANENKTLFSL